MPPCEKNNTSFLAKLQNCRGLDLRDNRGKRHDLAILLLGVTLAILSNRDGKMSSMHRHLQKHQERLLEFLDLEPRSCVSRSHLPIVLEKVSVTEFDRLLEEQGLWGQKISLDALHGKPQTLAPIVKAKGK